MSLDVEFICKGGFGSEAEIDVQLRRVFPGIGGTIHTYQAIPVAFRREFSSSPNVGHRLFLKHAIIKKLEDYFFKKGFYHYAHVTRPLGSTSEGYIYEWAFGSDVFPWYYSDDSGESIPVELDDWRAFIEAFESAGIDLRKDCADPDNGRLSQNIIHQFPYGASVSRPRLNRLWKRIDFGDKSISINFDRLLSFLDKYEADMRENLRVGRFDMIKLSCKYLLLGDRMDPREFGELTMLVRDYRLSTLSHLNTRGVESSGAVKLF
ncbi:MAG: hypothetical protein N3F64_00570 [Nitrososphaeria archaeon]|nr:hypothetical protein [Nitrososphaeria archaeon]